MYWLFRVSGLSPDLSFGLWMVSMSALNYAAGLWLFGRGLGFGLPASVAGASLVAFGTARVNQMGHPQLLPVLLCINFHLCLVAAGRRRADEPGSPGGLLADGGPRRGGELLRRGLSRVGS